MDGELETIGTTHCLCCCCDVAEPTMAIETYIFGEYGGQYITAGVCDECFEKHAIEQHWEYLYDL